MRFSAGKQGAKMGVSFPFKPDSEAEERIEHLKTGELAQPMSRSRMPLVSVIVPAHNAEAHLPAALASVCAQSYRELEILVVDDGSSDSTASIVRRMSQTDTRIRLLSQENSGVASARNHGIEASEGEFIAPLDADDIWYPDKIKRQMEVMLGADEELGLVYCGWDIISEKGDPQTRRGNPSLVTGDLSETLIWRNPIGCASTPLIRRSCFDRIGLYDTSMFEKGCQGCEDWDLYLRLAEYYRFEAVPETLLAYRRGKQSMSASTERMEASYEVMMNRLRRRRPGIAPRLYRKSRQHYHVYLAGVSSRSGNKLGAFRHLGIALASDPGFIVSRPLSMRALGSVLKLLLQ